MSEIVSGSASIVDLYQRIGLFKGSPVRIAQATFGYLDDVMNGRVDLVDATNPFIMLLETSAVHTALAINESLLNLRRSYVGLAETDEDIYRHMTDDEYIGRFSVPGSANFTFMIDYNDLLNALVQDDVENCKKGILHRDTFVTVDGTTFTFQYPIVFRRFPNGVMQVTYDTSINSPVSKPSNNLIAIKARQDSRGQKLLYFTIPLKQFSISSSNFALQRSSIFTKDIQFSDQFVFARVFQKNGDNPSWVEMFTTHSDQVFDKNKPTAVLQVTTNSLNVSIPYIYNTQGSVSGQIRIDLYTSKGQVDINLGNYLLDKFEVKLRNIDTIRDDSVFTNIWGNITLLAFSQDILTGGINAVTFDELKNHEKNIDYYRLIIIEADCTSQEQCEIVLNKILEAKKYLVKDLQLRIPANKLLGQCVICLIL